MTVTQFPQGGQGNPCGRAEFAQAQKASLLSSRFISSSVHLASCGSIRISHPGQRPRQDGRGAPLLLVVLLGEKLIQHPLGVGSDTCVLVVRGLHKGLLNLWGARFDLAQCAHRVVSDVGIGISQAFSATQAPRRSHRLGSNRRQSERGVLPDILVRVTQGFGQRRSCGFGCRADCPKRHHGRLPNVPVLFSQATDHSVKKDGYFSFVKTLSPPRRFTVIWFFAASNVKTAAPSIWNLSSAVASRGTADVAPGG